MEDKSKYSTDTRLIKKVLVKKYGFENVRVKKGRGTASMWVEVFLKVKKNHTCEFTPCYECSKEHDKVYFEAYDLIKKSGSYISFYYNDANEKHDCLIIDIDLV